MPYHSAMTLAQSLLGFALLAAVVTITPGLDTVLVLRQALRGRRLPMFGRAGTCGTGLRRRMGGCNP